MLRRLVQNALDLGEQRRVSQPAGIRLVGDSARMQQLRATIAKLARSQAPVYIAGESGVGKELVARLIHEQGPRSGGPFVPVNCGAIPSELMESELFGHKKGSFTGAHADKEGLFQTANGGTLFLDEVAELPLHLQVKLLRVIQEKNVRPVGASIEVPLDVRILSATHKNLAKLVEDGKFRHDLYYRINVIGLPVPPLRERTRGHPADRGCDPQAPLGGTGRVAAPPCPQARWLRCAATVPGQRPRTREHPGARGRTLRRRRDRRRRPRLAHGPAGALDRNTRQRRGPRGVAPGPPSRPRCRMPWNRSSANAIQKALEACRYNKTKAAAQLGITFRALRYKLKKLEME